MAPPNMGSNDIGFTVMGFVGLALATAVVAITGGIIGGWTFGIGTSLSPIRIKRSR